MPRYLGMNAPTTAEDQRDSANLDPLTGEPGAHPLGAALGAAAGGGAGLAIAAAVAGPIGVAAATVGGAIAGGYVGVAAAEIIDPTEDTYWRAEHSRQPYAQPDFSYADYQPAYHAGYAGFVSYGPRSATFEEAERHVEAEYRRMHATLPWKYAREAAMAAWNRASGGQRQRMQTDATGEPRVEAACERANAALLV
jgi:hypothetical protein